MDRRGFISAVTFSLLTAPLATEAQQAGKVARVGTLDYGAAQARAHLWEAFGKGLREFGYVEGQNVVFERRWADGKAERLSGLAADLVRVKVDIIVVAGTPAALAIARATATIPIVITTGAADPVTAGLISSFGRPGTNVTGVTTLGTDLIGKRLEMLREAVPRIQRVALLWDTTNRAGGATVQETEVAARSLGVPVRAFGVRGVRDFKSAFASITSARAGALIVGSSAMFFSERRLLADLSLQHRLPTTFAQREYVEAGGLLAYGPNLKAGFHRSATYVDRILKGAKPADLPVERPTTFELVINLKTAKVLGLTIPQSLLVRADEVIQ
jgi:putative ABC transport system substrate-binding protein